MIKTNSNRLRCVSQLDRSSGLHADFSFHTSNARGSALTEFFFLTIIMLPLFFGIPMIGKLIDLKQTAVQAGRYAAWEATGHTGAGEHGNNPGYLQDRFFGGEDSVISSAPSDAGQNKLWGDNSHTNGRAELSAIRVNENTISVRNVSAGEGSTVASAIGSTVHAAGNLLGAFSDGDWDLERNGLVKRTVSLEVKSNSWVADALSSCGSGTAYGCLSESAVIMTDGWSSGNDQQAAKRVKSLVPASALHEVGNLISNVGRIPLFEELRDLDGAFGYVEMNELPTNETLPRWEDENQ